MKFKNIAICFSAFLTSTSIFNNFALKNVEDNNVKKNIVQDGSNKKIIGDNLKFLFNTGDSSKTYFSSDNGLFSWTKSSDPVQIGQFDVNMQPKAKEIKSVAVVSSFIYMLTEDIKRNKTLWKIDKNSDKTIAWDNLSANNTYSYNINSGWQLLNENISVSNNKLTLAYAKFINNQLISFAFLTITNDVTQKMDDKDHKDLNWNQAIYDKNSSSKIATKLRNAYYVDNVQSIIWNDNSNYWTIVTQNATFNFEILSDSNNVLRIYWKNKIAYLNDIKGWNETYHFDDYMNFSDTSNQLVYVNEINYATNLQGDFCMFLTHNDSDINNPGSTVFCYDLDSNNVVSQKYNFFIKNIESGSDNKIVVSFFAKSLYQNGLYYINTENQITGSQLLNQNINVFNMQSSTINWIKSWYDISNPIKIYDYTLMTSSYTPNSDSYNATKENTKWIVYTSVAVSFVILFFVVGYYLYRRKNKKN